MKSYDPETDREVIRDCIDQFRLLLTFAEATGPIRQGTKRISKVKAIAFEARSVIDVLNDYLAKTE